MGFDEIPQSPARKHGECPVCHAELATGEERGRVQVILYGVKYVTKDDPAWAEGGSRQKQRTIGQETRIMCEDCSVELYNKIIDQLPVRMKRSDGEEKDRKRRENR